MRLLLAFLLLAGPAAQAQDGEDAEHRADRLRTEQLNLNAAAAAGRRGTVSARDEAAYAAARARYQRAVAEWRRRVAACEAGETSACADR